MMNLGDFAEDAVIDFKWSSNDADGASITRATDGTISVYKDNSTTQSTAGVTDTEDFDSLTGIHHCRIDLSADAYYEIGEDYDVVLSAATIDGQTVNAVLAHFSIENRFMRGTDGANTTTPPTAAAIRAEIDSNSTQLAAILLDTGTTLDGKLDAIAGYLDTEIAAILADTDELQADLADGGRLDLLIDGIKTVTDDLTDTDTVASAIWTYVIENSKTAEQYMRGMKAALIGKASGGGTSTLTFRDDADTKNRISETVTSVGNRTAVVLDLT